MINKLNFGCGKDIKKGWTNVDIQEDSQIDKSFDFEKFPYPFKDDTFDYILVDNVIEHLKNPKDIMDELWRISKPGAIIDIRVPYFRHDVAYNDPTHTHFYNRRAIEQICGKNSYSDTEKKFEILENKRIAGNIKKKIPKIFLKIMDKLFVNTFIEIKAKIRVRK